MAWVPFRDDADAARAAPRPLRSWLVALVVSARCGPHACGAVAWVTS
ncbi:hypothetical protein [Pseudoglutamicibacter cumminsii]|nr:hypothetical protein [Pseudoglutamicibacter cumminsii]